MKNLVKGGQSRTESELVESAHVIAVCLLFVVVVLSVSFLVGL